MKHKIVPLSFELVERPLDMLLAALANKIEREWPRNLLKIKGARELFLTVTRTAEVTYQTVRWICADKPCDPFRRPEYSISVPPLNRTLLDSIFMAIFLMEDLPKRCEWYFKAAWREEKLELGRYQSEYASLDEWREWLKRLSLHCDSGINELGVSAREAANPVGIKRWLNPGQMVRYGIKDGSPVPADRQFLQYLNDWFYRDLSSQTHLGGLGLMKRGGFLLTYDRHNTLQAARLDKYKRTQVGMTLTLVLALVSELEAYFRFGLSERAKYVWTILLNSIPLSKELYEKRYSALLVQSAT